MSTSSLDERRREHRSLRLRRMLLASAAAVGVLALAAAAWFSPLLALTDVKAEGQKLVNADDVASFVLDQHGGTPLPQLRSQELKDELAEEFPLAHSFDISPAGPRTLRVKVHDRQPAFVVKRAEGWEIYDPEAVVLSKSDSRPKGVPLYVGTADRTGIETASQLVSSLGENAEHTAAVAVKSPTQTAVVIRHSKDYSAVVILGEPIDVEAKIATARTVMQDEPAAIDVQSTAVPAATDEVPAWARVPQDAYSQG
ncbi:MULTISPECIES: cell division protein FtsQ/DivIB [unclassified Brevibacterium]|uniref:cell division protein FtsQ/DivIB n=1 Tax=unclassified Brevibacterium TaxID=2614124 RepID=UPI0008ABAD8A|nr:MULTISPECIES: hypothetical protein [unclassified Brevibacterium]OFS25394.1 hypothetical protein HMPREF3162_08730 [Brevibacterium sp. HMSC07C04]